MKHHIITALLCLLLALPVGAQAMSDTPKTKVVYSSIASDLPLMPGMVEKPDSLVMFDAPEGRIAEITMTTVHGQIDVLNYYKDALPALGWYAENPQVWTREGEMLTIRFGADKTVLFHIEPAAKRAPRSSFGKQDDNNAPAPHWNKE